MKELISRIEHDLKQAKARRDAFEKGTREYGFNQGIVAALEGVLSDIKELKLNTLSN